MKLKDLAVSAVNVRETPAENDESIEKLAQSIKELHMLSRMILRPSSSGYEIIAGSRRYHALLTLHGDDFEVPEEDYTIVNDIDDKTALLLSINENQQRQSLSPYELNRAALKLNQIGIIKPKEIARILNITPYRLKRIIHISEDANKLPSEIQEELKKPPDQSVFNDAHWEKIRNVENRDVIKDVFDYVMDKECPPREIPSIIKSIEKTYKDSEHSDSDEVLVSGGSSEEVEGPFEFSHRGILRLDKQGDKEILKIIGRKGEEEEIPLEYYADYLRYPDKFKCTVSFKLKIKPVLD